MDERGKLRALRDLGESLGIEIRPAPPAETSTAGAGALVRLRGKEILFLDGRAPLSDQIELLAGVLHGRPELEDRFIPPELRETIDQAAGTA